MDLKEEENFHSSLFSPQKYAFQGVCEGEGESGVSGGFHGLEGAAETGEGADRIRGVDLQGR